MKTVIIADQRSGFLFKKITVKESAEKLIILEDMEYLDTKSFGSSIV